MSDETKTPAETLLSAIRDRGEACCVYGGKPWPERTCDCKYGHHWGTRPGGEQTGCPELRDIYNAARDVVDPGWRERAMDALRAANQPNQRG